MQNAMDNNEDGENDIGESADMDVSAGLDDRLCSGWTEFSHQCGYAYMRTYACVQKPGFSCCTHVTPATSHAFSGEARLRPLVLFVHAGVRSVV